MKSCFLGLVWLVAACQGTGSPQAAPELGSAPTPHILRLGPKPELPPPLEALDFLVGHWEGEAFGGWAEESWGPAKAGSMLGSFRLVHGDQTDFYELMVIEVVEGRPTLRVKHFGADLMPWEEGTESVNFPLIAVDGTTAWFDGLTLHRSGKEMLGYLALTNQGEVSEVTFHYHQVF